MKVAFLLGSLNRGGAETLVLDTLRKAENAPFEMILIHRKSGSMQADFYETGVKCIRCRSKISKPFRCIIELRRILKTECVDVIHTQQRIDAFLAFFAIIGTKTKIVDTFHGFDTGYGFGSRFIVKFSGRHSDALVFVSQYEANHYISRYAIPKEKTHVVYNGIDFSKFDNVNEVPELPRHNPDSVRMAMVGNFVSERNQFDVCVFLSLIKKLNFDFYFVGGRVPGCADSYDRCVDYCIKQGMNEMVHFLGIRNDVPSILKEMDAFIYCSHSDTFGIAVVEAIVSGIPVFVNDLPVFKEISQHGKLAVVYQSGNLQDLYDKFMDFLGNDMKYKNNAMENAVEVKNLYAIEQHIINLFGLYNTLN